MYLPTHALLFVECYMKQKHKLFKGCSVINVFGVFFTILTQDAVAWYPVLWTLNEEVQVYSRRVMELCFLG